MLVNTFLCEKAITVNADQFDEVEKLAREKEFDPIRGIYTLPHAYLPKS